MRTAGSSRSGQERAGRGAGHPSRSPGPWPLVDGPVWPSSTSRKSASGASHSWLPDGRARRPAGARPRQQQPLVGEARGGVDPELDPARCPIGSGPTLTAVGNGHRQSIGAARANVADQHGRAAVYEPLGQAFVQGIRQPRSTAWSAQPICRVRQPVDALGDIGPAADAGDDRASASISPATLSSRATSAANHSCGMCPPSPT